jgi:hypothetical protein
MHGYKLTFKYENVKNSSILPTQSPYFLALKKIIDIIFQKKTSTATNN